MLPIHQVCKGETGPAQLLLEPDTEVMQCYLGRQPSLKPSEGMRTLTTEAEGVVHLVGDRLDDLAHSGRPAASALRPGLLAIPLRRAHDLRSITVPPACVRGLPLKALITDIGPQGGLAYAPASGVRGPTQEAVELSAMGRGGKGCPHEALGMAVERSFAGEAGPLPKEAQPHHLIPGEGSLR
jgi:hypothetical protein